MGIISPNHTEIAVNTHSVSFTPARRRAPSFKLDVHDIDSIAWTAARCQRLLRTLTSRVEILKKNSSKSAPINFTSNHELTTVSAMTKRPHGQIFKGTQESEPEWQQARKRVRRKYYGRGRIPEDAAGSCCRNKKRIECQRTSFQSPHVSKVRGEINVPTPVINRIALDRQANQSLGTHSWPEEGIKTKNIRRPLQRYVTKDGEAHFQLQRDIRRLRKTLPPDIFALHMGLHNALEALLRATTSSKVQEKKKGSKSLLSMCLRSVPQSIVEEEAWEAERLAERGLKSALEVRDFSAEIYTELELMGSSDRGWKHLQTVVRAHGVQIVCAAISAGLIETQFAGTWVSLCIHTGALEEAEMLLSALLGTIPNHDPTAQSSELFEKHLTSPLSTYGVFVTYTGRTAAYFRQLSHIYQSGQLSILWLATREFSMLWTKAFTSFSHDASPEAADFLATVVPLMCQSGDSIEAHGGGTTMQNGMVTLLYSTISSVLATLAAMSLLDELAITNNHRSAPTIQRQKSIIHLMRSIGIECEATRSNLDSRKTALVLISCVLVFPTNGDESQSAEESFDGLIKLLGLGSLNGDVTSLGEGMKEAMSKFLCSVARQCGRGISNAGFDHFKIGISRLQSHIAQTETKGTGILRGIIVDSAYMFAHENTDRKYLQYAQDLSMELEGSHVRPRTSPKHSNKHISTQIRWEEGISEWVTATPSMEWKGALQPEDNSSGDRYESECDTPIRPIVKHRKPRMLLTDSDLPVPRSRISDLVPESPNIRIGTALLLKKITKEAEQRTQCFNHNDDDEADDETDPLHDESFHSGCSLSKSLDDSHFVEERRCGSRVSRLRGGVLRSDTMWSLFEDDEDELNSSLISIVQTTPSVLTEIANNSRKYKDNIAGDKAGKVTNLSGFLYYEDSEDELGA